MAKGSKYKWAILVLTTFSQTCNAFILLSVSVIAPFLVESFTLTSSQIGLASGASGVGAIFTALLSGYFTDRFGARRVLFVGLGGASVFIMIASIMNNFVVLVMILFLVGSFAISVGTAGIKATINWFPIEQRGTALGIRQTGVSLGGVLASLTLPMIALRFGWRVALVFTGVLGLLMATFFLLVYREKETMEEKPKDKNAVPVKFGLDNLKSLIRNKNIWMAATMSICFVGVQYSLLTYIQLFLFEKIEYTIAMASFCLTLMQMGSMIGRIVWGVASDRLFGSSRKRPLAIIGSIIIIMSWGMLLISRFTPIWVVWVAVFILGFSALGWNGLYFAMVTELADTPSQAATTVGFSESIHQVGKFAVPPMFGFMVDLSGSYNPGWMFLSFLGAGGLFALSKVKKKQHTETDENNDDETGPQNHSVSKVKSVKFNSR